MAHYAKIEDGFVTNVIVAEQDFIDTQDPPRFIIETKGNPNEAFPLRWKLFKMHLVDEGINTNLFMPRNQKDCEKVIEILKDIL